MKGQNIVVLQMCVMSLFAANLFSMNESYGNIASSSDSNSMANAVGSESFSQVPSNLLDNDQDEISSNSSYGAYRDGWDYFDDNKSDVSSVAGIYGEYAEYDPLLPWDVTSNLNIASLADEEDMLPVVEQPSSRSKSKIIFQAKKKIDDAREGVYKISERLKNPEMQQKQEQIVFDRLHKQIQNKKKLLARYQEALWQDQEKFENNVDLSKLDRSILKKGMDQLRRMITAHQFELYELQNKYQKMKQANSVLVIHGANKPRLQRSEATRNLLGVSELNRPTLQRYQGTRNLLALSDDMNVENVDAAIF